MLLVKVVLACLNRHKVICQNKLMVQKLCKEEHS